MPRRSLPFALSIVCALAAAGLPARAETPTRARHAARATAPAADCFDARRMREAFQSDARTLAIRLDDESRWRVALRQDCPGMLRSPHPRLTGPQGWICGAGGDARLESGDRQCAIAAVERIDARDYAGLALNADRAPSATRAPDELDTIEVRATRRRGFQASHSYCLDARYMRGWHDDGNDLIVEVSPVRNGGNRYYRVELGSPCAESARMSEMHLESRIGGNVICGNAGDRARFSHDDSPGPLLRSDAEQWRIPSAGCIVSRVYPILPE